MSKSRREFLVNTSLGLVATAVMAQEPTEQKPSEPPAGAPPAFGTAPPVGPEVSPETFVQAEKLVQVELKPAELKMAADTWRSNLAPVYERRVGPKKVAIEPQVAPYSHWNPVLPGQKQTPLREEFVRSKADPGPLPSKEEDIAFAPLTHLSRWVERKQITSQRLAAFGQVL